jgi:hypothetical protein
MADANLSIRQTDPKIANMSNKGSIMHTVIKAGPENSGNTALKISIVDGKSGRRAALSRAFLEEGLHAEICGPACKRDPVSGVIGV